MQQLEDLHRDKDSLNELANELRGKSTDTQISDMDRKTADADDKFTQLEASLNDRCLFILQIMFI